MMYSYRNRFSAPSLNRNSRSICLLNADRARCNFARHVAASGSVPCEQKKKTFLKFSCPFPKESNLVHTHQVLYFVCNLFLTPKSSLNILV